VQRTVPSKCGVATSNEGGVVFFWGEQVKVSNDGPKRRETEAEEQEARFRHLVFDDRFSWRGVRQRPSRRRQVLAILVVLVSIACVASAVFAARFVGSLDFACTQDNRNKTTCFSFYEQPLPSECPPGCVGADLRDANLSGIDLSWANLREAILSRAELRGAKLLRASLLKADLRRADLRRANLNSADLREADLYRADLSQAYLRRAELENADLRMAGLYGADLSVIRGRWADFAGADLSGARLREANLLEANLSQADLSDAVLYEAILVRADLSGAILAGADLRRADLREAELGEADLQGALYNDHTRWPEGFDPVEAGAVFQY
jgi:uncharacterized protein YjbI with pentapeptide repeats